MYCSRGRRFCWRLSMSGDSLNYYDLPVNGLPQELDTARKVKTTLEKIQQLPPDIMWSLPAVSISKLAGRIIALSACPQGQACMFYMPDILELCLHL